MPPIPPSLPMRDRIAARDTPHEGRWWGNDPIEKTQAEIDILGEQDKTTALFGECKWTNERVDLGVLETLVHRSHLFQHSKVYCFLFSKSGFTKGCMERATELGGFDVLLPALLS